METKETKGNGNDLVSSLLQKDIEQRYREKIGFDTLESDYNKLMSKISLNQSKVKSKSFISPEENDALSKEIEAMRKRMQAYNDYLGYVGADSKATEGVTSTIGNLSGVTEMLKSQRELYGKYKTADDWYNYIKESEEAQKQYDTAMSYDIDAGQKNVDALKTTMDEAAKLTYENERRLQALQAAVGKPNYKFLSSEYTKWYEQNKDKIAANEKAYNDAKAAYEKALAEHNSNVESKRFYEKEAEYRKLAQNPDYDALSGKANTEWYNISDTSLAAKQGNGGAGAKALGFIDNVVDKYGDIALLLAINPGTAAFALPVNIAEWFLDKGADRRAAYDELEDDERKIFNYVFNTEGEKAAGEYLDHMKKTLEYRRTQTDKAKLDKEISKAVSWVPGKWAEEVAEVPVYGIHGLKTGAESAIPNMVAGVLNKELDTSRNEYLLGKINEEGNVASKAAANIGQSIGNMAPSIVVAAALQGLGIPAGWASAASSVQMGFQARGSAYNEALRAGYTKDQASTYATVNGALEATLQYALNPAFGLSGKLVSKGIAKFAPNVVKSIAAMEKGVLRYVTAFSIASASSAGSEAIEEGIQAALDPYVRQILLGEDNDGIDWGEVGYSALLGGVTGGLMGAGTIVNDTKLPQLKKEAFAKNYDTAKGESAEQRFSVYANKLTEENSAILKSVCELVNKGDVKGAIKQLDTAIARYGYAAEYARQEMRMRGDYFTKGQDQMQELKARIKDGKFNTATAETVLRNESEVYQTVAEINDGVAKTLLDKSLSNSKIEKAILNDTGTAKAFERLTGINLSQYNTVSAKRNAIREAAIAYQQISDTDAVKNANELITKNNTEASASKRSENRVEAQKILNEEIVKTRKEAKTFDKETAKKANIKERILNNIKNAIRNDETIKLASVDGSVPVSKAGKKASVSSGEISIETDMAKAKEGIYEEYLAPFDTVGDGTVDEIEAAVLKNINEKIENTKGEERKALIEQKQKVKEYAKLIKGYDEEVLDYAKQKSDEALQRKEKRFKQILKKNGLDLDVEQGGYLYYNKDDELITEKEYNALKEKGEKVKVLTKNGFASGNTIHLFSNIAFGRWFKHIDSATGIMVTSRSGFDVSASEIVDFIIGHELVHAGERNGDGTVNKVLNSIKGTKADRYYEIAKRMKGEKTSAEADEHWNALKDIYVRAESSKMSRAEAEEKVTDEYIYEEIAADYVGSAFLDSGTLDRTLANRGIVDYLVVAAKTLSKLLKERKLDVRAAQVSVLMDNLTAMVNQTYKLHPETAQKTTESPVAKESSDKVKTAESKETATEDVKEAVTDDEKMSVAGESSETADTSKLQRAYEKTSQNVNTKFSLSSDSDGKQLTKEQSEYFKDSKVVDAKGHLKVMYHGTNADFTVFDRSKLSDKLGFFFTEDKREAADYGKPQAYYLNIKNPFDMFGDTPITDFLGDSPKYIGGEFNYEAAVKGLREAGYDGIYSYSHGTEWYIAFDSNQVKLTTNTSPTSDPDVRYSLSPETDGVVEAANGDPVAVDEGNGSTKWSLSTYEEEGRENLAKYLKNKKKDKSLTQKDVDDIMTSMDEIYDICKNFEDEYATFGAWSKAKVEYDKDGNPVFSVVKANGEYKMNLDFSLVCKKRRALDTVFNRLIEMGKINTFDFGQEEIVRINDIIRDHGFEVACALCFVDAKRYRQQKVADDFVELYNGLVESLDKNGVGIDYFNFGGDPSLERIENGIDTLSNDELDFTEIDRVIKTEEKESVLKKAARHLKNHPEDRKLLSRGDFMSSKGFGEVKKHNPAILSLYNSKKGTGGPKAAFGDVQYMNEIIKSTTFKPKKAYSVGGVRIQSFSDYVARLVFDYVQMVGDLAAKKLPAHAYTKEALFVKQFGLTGIKINMSLIPEIGDGKYAGLNADGSYAWASESFPIDEAFAIQDDAEYGRNCGTIAVGVSDEHIRKLLSDPKIRMVIPYHKSGINPIVAHMMKIEGFTDYTSIQNTTHRDGTKISDDEANGMPNFNELMHKGMSPVEASKVYVEWCEKNGYRPKFPQFAYVIKNGEKVFNENYYKLLEDFTTSFNGETVAQEAVKMRFPDETSAFGSMKDLIQQGLNEDDIRQGELDENVDAIVSEIAEMLGDDEKMSVSAEEDTEYLEAVERGDMETAKKMVEKVAKKAGYDTPELYHGSGTFGFTTFRPGRIYATASQGVAMGYNRGQGLGRIRSASRKYIPNDGTVETAIANAKNIMGAELSKVTDKVRLDIINKANEIFAEVSNKIGDLDNDMSRQEYDAFWEYISDKYGEDKSEEYVNAYQGLAYMLSGEFSAEDILENSRWFASDMNRYHEWKRTVNELYSEEYDKIKGTTLQPMFRYLMGYEFGDALIDLEYGINRLADGRTKVVAPTGGLMFLDDIIDAIEAQKDVGIYQLYGNVGSKPLVIDEGKVFWDAIPFEGKYRSSDYIAQWAKDNGYTSVLFKTVLDPSSGGSANVYADEYVFFDSNQVKSADPVTYDSDGNIIPLEERFNPKNDDIRYSVTPEEDAEYLAEVEGGNTVYAGYLVDKTARAAGYKKRMFHETNAENIHVFDISRNTHGGTDSETPYGIFTKTTNKNIGLGNKQMALYVKADNTLYVKDRADVKNKIPTLVPYYDEIARIDREYDKLCGKWEDAEMEALEEWMDENPDADMDKVYPTSYIIEGKPANIDSQKYLEAHENYQKARKEWEEKYNEIAIKCKDIITSYLRDNDYDSMYFEIDGGSRGRQTDSLIVLDPNQVKSAEAVTYDDNGNVIPLSERFNPENDDIRYSVSESDETDSRGKRLTTEQVEFFKDSKIRDRRGDLLRVYHATNADFTVFDKAKIGGKNGALFGRGFYFSKDESQAIRYGRNVGEFYLNIKKPFDYLNFKKKDVVRILDASGYEYDKRRVNYFDYDDVEDVDLISDLLEDVLPDVDVYATFSDMVQKAGYDGIVAGREIIAFEPEQIKRTDNKNPTSDPDVRYSVTEVEEETAPTYAQLKRELGKQIKRNERLSEELVQTHGKKLDTKLAKERLEEIVKRYGGDIKASKIVEKYKDAYEYIYYGRLRETNEDGTPAVHKNGKPKYTENAELNVETANKMVDDLAREIIDSAVAYDEDIDTYRAVLKDVRETAITVPESVKESGFEDVGGWNEFRKKSYGNIRFVNNNGADISTVYNSLATKYPEMFPDGITDPAKQIKRIAEVTREIRQSGILPKSIYSDVEVQSVLEDVKSDLFDLMADKEVRKVTKADEYANTKTELEKTRSEARANKETAQGLSWRLAEQKLADDMYYGKKIAEIRRRRDEQISYLRERFNDRMSERSESQKRMHQEKMAIKRFNDLTNRLTHPTKTKHVPEAMANDLALFLNRTVLSTRTKANAEAREKIIASLDSYFDAKQKKGNTIEWSQISDENAGRFSDELLLDMKEYGVGNFDRMNSDELHNYNNLLLRIIHEINTEDKLFHSGESASVAAQKAKRQFMQLAKNNSKINWLEGFIKDQKYFASDPESFFTNLGIDELTSAYHRLSARQDVFARTLRTLTDKLGEIVDGAIPKDWREHTYDFTTENGQTIRLTKAKAMTIYLLSKQEASRKRLLNEKGGVVPTDTSVNYLHLEESATRTDKNGNPKKELVLPKTTILANMGGSPAVLTEGDLDLIEFSLGDRAKDVADKISSLLNNEVSELGNEVALALEGYKKFGVENYFPMMVAENGKTYEQIVKDTDAQIRNKSFTKDRTGSAGVALVADDVFNVVERHLLGMSQYYAYEEALRDFQKIYTMRPGGEASLRLTMNSRLSSNSAVHKFIANFIDSLQGAQMKAGEEKLLSEKLLGHYKAAQIGLNLSVVAKQPTAFIRALPELSAKGVVVGSLNPKKLLNFSKDGFRSDIKEMVENSGLAQMKAWGFSEYGSALSVGELYDKNAGDWEKKLNNIVSKPAEFADLITWAAIWRACKTASNSMEETVEKFNDVIRKTQVVNSAFTSTQIANQGGMSKLAFAFKNEPLKTFNYARATLFDALEGKEGARKKAVKVAAATLLNTFVVAMISSGFSLMRDDEEDKWEDFWSRVGDNMLSDVLNNVFIFAGDIYAAVESGLDNKDVERMDLAPIVDAVQIAKRLVDPPKNYTPARAVNDISKALSGITGIPLSNITRAGKTLHGRLAEIIDTPEMWYEYNKVWNNVKGDKATFKAILTDALNTDYNAFVSIKNDLVKRGYTQTDIDNAVKNSDRFVTAWNDSPEAFRKELNEAQKIDKMFSSDYVIKMMDKRRSDIVGDLFELMMKGEKMTAAEKREEILNFRDPKSKRLTTEKTLNELLEDKAMSKMRSDVNNIVLTSDLDIDKKLEEIFKRYEKFGVKLSDVKKVAREKDKL